MLNVEYCTSRSFFKELKDFLDVEKLFALKEKKSKLNRNIFSEPQNFN